MTVTRDEEGMTLVELIVAVLILAIIMVPLFSSLVVGLASTQQAAQKTTNSTDQQVLASFFVNDVQSADDVANAGTCGGAATVVQFHWVDPVGNVDKVAAYATSNGGLQRVYCEGGATVRTNQLITALGPTLTVTCDGAVCAVGSTPRAVVMDVSEIGSTSDTSRETYTYRIEGTRRAS